jgi:hypothetical protein
LEWRIRLVNQQERQYQEWLNNLDLYFLVDRAIAHHQFHVYTKLGTIIGALLFGVEKHLKSLVAATRDLS